MTNLIKDIKSGKENAFELFYKSEFCNLTYFIRSYIHDADVAFDIAQESLMALWENRSLINENQNVRAYVFTIARNKAINYIKSKKNRCANINIEEMIADAHAISDASVEKYIDSLSLEKLIFETYNNLSPTSKESFILSRIDGLTNEQIAKKKGITVKAVEYHIRISLKFFRKRIKNYLPVLGILTHILYN